MNNNNDLLRNLIELYTNPAIPHSGPRLFVRGEGSGYRILDAKLGLEDMMAEIPVYVGVHPGACLDTWARRVDNQRMACPVIDCTMVKGTPPPFTPTGVIEAGAWTIYLWALEHRVPFAEFDRVEALRYRLSTMSIPRQQPDDGFMLPGAVCGISESTRTQTETFYSYGTVAIPLRGVTEQRATLLTFDADRRVTLEELESIAPQVNKPRGLAEALSQSVRAQVQRSA